MTSEKEEYKAVSQNPPPPPTYESATTPAAVPVHTFDIESPPQNNTRRQTSRREQAFSIMSEKRIFVGIAIAVGVVAAILAIILPISFSSLEYYQLGFRKRKSSGTVDTSKVYESGRHLVGPDTEFKPFPADAHFETFDKVTVFTSDKLQVSISAHFQYFLRPHQLDLLHKNYDVHYEDVLKNNAQDALKGKATLFSTREYIRDRKAIEKSLFDAIRDRLGGRCCEKACETDKTCIPSCKPYDSCSEEDFGLFAEVRYFQLASLDIPNDLADRYLRALVLKEENEAEKLRQEAQVVRKETESQVKDTDNKAQETRRNADSESSLISSIAQANATATVERSRTDGLKFLYSEIGLTQQNHKASFDYLRTLSNKKDVSMAIDFDQLIAGNLK